MAVHEGFDDPPQTTGVYRMNGSEKFERRMLRATAIERRSGRN
jgi:hypothetical protein